MLRLVQGIYNGFNNKENTLAAFIDLEKAFDSVWRDGLLVKLHRFGIRGRLWKWIEGFLRDRKARCHLKGQYGPIFFTTVGLPQGSVIYPIFFIIFLQDISKEISSNGVKYADDGTIWVTGNDIKDLLNREEDLRKIYSWTAKWRMNKNYEKQKFVLSQKSETTNKNELEISLNQQKIKYNSTPKILGVTLDDSLSFQPHISKVEKKANKAISSLGKFKYVENINTQKLAQLYMALVLPILEYASIAWHGADTSKLEEVQRKSLALCLDAIRTSGREALEVELNIQPLEIRRMELSIREAGRILSKDVDIPIKASWENWRESEKTEK